MVTRLKDPSDLDWAYLAGLIDGEGSLMVNMKAPTKRNPAWQPYHSARLTITNTYEPIGEWLEGTFGGHSFNTHPGTEIHKARWEWVVTGHLAAEICGHILPYLKIKHQQAQCLIDLMDGTIWPRKHGVPIPQGEVDRRDAIRSRLRELNHKGPQAETKREDFL